MRRAWFCYEMGAKGPCPCIYYDDLPNEKNKLNRTVLQKHLLDNKLYFGLNDEVDVGFEFLALTFPYTGKHYDVEEAIADA